MRDSRWFPVVCVLLSLCSWSFAKNGWSKNYEKALQEAREKNLPLIIQFGFEGCVFCRTMEKDVLSNDRVEKVIKQKFVAAKLELEDYEALAEKFQIVNFPTTLVLETCEVPILSNEGSQTVDEFLDFLNRGHRRYEKVNTPKPLEPEPDILAISGFCPVHFTRNKQWSFGKEDLTASHHGQTYRFSSEEAKKEFLAEPDAFIPQYRGFDPVEATENDRAVLGVPKFGSIYQEKLYLFATEANREKFIKEAQKYLRLNYHFTGSDIEPAKPMKP